MLADAFLEGGSSFQNFGEDDTAEDRRPPAQTGKFLLAETIYSGQQVNNAERRPLESQQSELPVRRRTSANESVALLMFYLFPDCGAHPNIAILRCERAESVQFSGSALAVEIFRPEIDRLTAKQELRRVLGPKGLQKPQVVFNT